MSGATDNFETIVLPHVRYMHFEWNKNGYVYKIYKGEDESLTNGKVYEFHYCMYSPNRETKYKEYLVTHMNDDKTYTRFEDTRKDWSPVTKKKRK